MTLETYAVPDDLYVARGADVNVSRPVFTGDIFGDVPIPGAQEGGPAIVIDHPCAMRIAHARLAERILMAPVRGHGPVGPEAWTRGYFAKSPLPEAIDSNLHVGCFDELGRATTESLKQTTRLACLSPFGVNLLQQRLIWHLTRVEVATFRIQEAFAHYLEEADLLEEWTDALRVIGVAAEDAAAQFEIFIRTPQINGRTLQEDVRDPQRRSAVRIACRAEARRICC